MLRPYENQVRPPPFLRQACRRRPLQRKRRLLLANDGDFCARDFYAFEAMFLVQVQEDFEVGGGGAKAFVVFARDGGFAGSFYGDGAGGELLRDEDGERLLAALLPIVEAGEDGVLVVEIVVEDGDERGVEGHVLFEGAGALHFEGNLGDAVGEEDVGAVGLFGLRGPLVADGCAVGLQGERAGYGGWGGLRNFDFGGAFGDPAS